MRRLQLAFVVALMVGSTLAVPADTSAQQRPTAEQAQQLLQSSPDLVAQLQQRLGASGMTLDQIHERLRAEGYPENLLDSYMSGSASGASGGALPTSTTFSALRALGIADSADIESLRTSALGSGRSVTGPPTCDDLLEQYGDSIPARRLPRDSTGKAMAAAASSDVGAPGDLRLCRERAAQLRVERDSGRIVFGLDLFRRSTSLFNANLSGPVDDNYRLGAGDRLVLLLTGDVQQAYTLDVTREGFVAIPEVGQVFVANLTLAQLNDLLYDRLGRAYSGVKRGAGATTHFSVSVARLRSNQIFVVGDVARPGSYQVSSAGTALTALYAAGGPSANGSLRSIEIRRGGKLVSTLDVYDYLLRGDASHDVRLESGDIVFVPVHGPRVRILGEITRPATYELKGRESLGDVLADAGGFTPLASTRRVQIERVLPADQRQAAGRDRVMIDIAGSDLATPAAAAGVPLDGGDVVRVFAVAERVANRIVVLGNVWSPGAIGFTSGMRVGDALKSAGGIKPDTYLGEVLVSRLRPDSTRVQLRATLRDSAGAVVGDFPLQEDDEMRVFSLTEFRPARYVVVSGAVQRSGRFPYRDGMTLRDLVLLAGGLQESAYLKEAEIARLPESRAAGTTAITERVPLDSTYLFERGPDGRYLGPPGIPAPAANAPEVILSPYDNVLILRQPNWELQRNVVINGEMRFPGRYTLTNKNERLSDLIQRAGGFTISAYPAGIRFVRAQDHLGRIGVDLPRVMADTRFRDNLILQDGDSIYIPPYSGVVDVGGAVNSPLAVAYVPGRNLDYYISAAGGPSRLADDSRAYVTQSDGKVESVHRHVFWFDNVPTPRPGSRVFVPEKDPKESSLFIAVAPILAQLAASVVTIIALTRK